MKATTLLTTTLLALATTAGCTKPNPDHDAPDAAIAPPDALTATCGNGVVEPGELCDDGNTVDGDACGATCTTASCLVPISFPTVQAAVTDPSCSTIYLAPGTYREAVAIARNVTLTGLTTGPAILDGEGQRTPVTIASGQVTLTRLTIRAGHAEHGGGIVNHGALLLRAVRVEANTASANLAMGGGIYHDGAALTLDATTVTGNHAVSTATGPQAPGAMGGGVYSDGGTIVVMNGSSIDGNDATVAAQAAAEGDGGGIYLLRGSLAVTGSKITKNVVTVTAGAAMASAYGGGVAMDAGGLTVSAASEVSFNTATATSTGAGVVAEGGGIAAIHGTIEGSSINDNLAHGEGLSLVTAAGGGLASESGSGGAWMLTGATMLRNKATALSNAAGASAIHAEGGGAYLHADGGVVLQGTTIANNAASAAAVTGSSGLGGGVSWASAASAGTSTLSVIQSTIADNGAGATNTGEAGGLAVSAAATASSVTIVASTISGNSAGGKLSVGGGVEALIATAATIAFVNSTISDNAVHSLASACYGSGVRIVAVAGATAAQANFSSTTLTANLIDAMITRPAAALELINNSGAGVLTSLLGNTLVSGNLGGQGECLTTGVAPGSLGGNLLHLPATGCAVAYGSDDLVGVATGVGPLADNGGPTKTHALVAGSNAIDAGNKYGCTDATTSRTALTTDQRGQPRLGNGRCDVGAFEK